MRKTTAISSKRREQIVEAAIAVIAEQGLQNLSLSEIESKAGMSRGQLTYYFPAKEEILLAVFDRVVQRMYQRMGTPEQAADVPPEQHSGWDWVQHLFTALLLRSPLSPEFGVLQYTFLSQIGHRDDFRQRLATLYEEWRAKMALGLGMDLARVPRKRAVSPRALATLVQAILHGLSMQAAADPRAFDREEVVALCLDMLGRYIWGEGGLPRRPAAARAPANGAGHSSSRVANGKPAPAKSKGRRRNSAVVQGGLS